MNGYIYNNQTRVIVTKISNVVACNDTTIKGDVMKVLGILYYIITYLGFNEGDALLTDIVDKRL